MPASSFVQRDHAGGAVDTAISTTIIGTSLTITIDDATGWPTGGANGPFHVIASYDLAGREKMEVQSRTGNTLMIADTGKRGIDGTSAQGHSAGAKIRHCWTAIDATEANEHITNVGLDHHTQYHNAARHASVVHTQGMMGTDSVGAPQIISGAVGADEIATGAVGSAELAADSVVAGKIAPAAIDTSDLFVAGVVDAAAIGASAVGSSELASAAVIAGKIGSAAIDDHGLFAADTQPFIVQSGDPGAVGANRIWFDTTNRQIKVRNAGNSAWDLYSEVSTGWQNFTPPFVGVALGTGGHKYGRIYRVGDLFAGVAGFTLGTGGSVSGVIDIDVNIAMHQVIGSEAERFTWLAAAKALDASTAAAFSGVALVDHNVAGDTFRGFATAGSNATWDGNAPFTWTDSDHFHAFFMGEAA